MFTTGARSHGCGHVVRTVYQGLRSTAADFVTKDYQRRNVTIKTDAIVDRVLLESHNGTDGLRATGVVTVAADGTEQIYRANKEVIISSGTYCSPAILLRSGIGPKDDLETLGIPCLVDLPGVGRNLMDHLVSQRLRERS